MISGKFGSEESSAHTTILSSTCNMCIYKWGVSRQDQKLKGKKKQNLCLIMSESLRLRQQSVSVDDRVLLWILRRSRAAVFHERMMRISIQPYNI